jgi:hypothetical protein
MSQQFLDMFCQLFTDQVNESQKGIHQTIQKNSVGFIPWDGITVGKDRIP